MQHKIKNRNVPIKFKTIDCVKYKEQCIKYNISNTPSIKFLIDNNIVDYNGKMNLNGFMSFLKDNVDNDNNNDNNNYNKLILFYTEWCGYSKQFMPIWTQFKKLIKENRVNIKLVEVDCELMENKKIAKKFGVLGYPTIKFVTNNGKIIDYDKPRTLDELQKFIMNNL